MSRSIVDAVIATGHDRRVGLGDRDGICPGGSNIVGIAECPALGEGTDVGVSIHDEGAAQVLSQGTDNRGPMGQPVIGSCVVAYRHSCRSDVRRIASDRVQDIVAGGRTGEPCTSDRERHGLVDADVFRIEVCRACQAHIVQIDQIDQLDVVQRGNPGRYSGAVVDPAEVGNESACDVLLSHLV